MTHDDVQDLAQRLAALGVKRVLVDGAKVELEFFERMPGLDARALPGTDVDGPPPSDPLHDGMTWGPGARKPTFRRRARTVPSPTAVPAAEFDDKSDLDPEDME